MMRKISIGPAYMSCGAWCILAIAVVSSVIVAIWPIPQRQGMEMWTYTRVYEDTYAGPITSWNTMASDQGRAKINMLVLDGSAQVRRTLSAFWSGTPVADVMEVEQDWMGRFFSGPIESVGFVDITDRLHDEGLYERINEPSFGLWTSRGRIFGIPHDIHPVMLAYRADILENAGIDITTVQTWDEFAERMRPLIQTNNGSGKPVHYPLSVWYTNMQLIETLMLQAGGGTFDADGNPIVASSANALVIATVIDWCLGSHRIAIDAPEFSPSGNQLRLDGRVVCTLMPDWLAGVWKQDMPQLEGKLKLMPLPAWVPGGSQTSAMGGTMIAIPRSTKHVEDAWAFAKYLYTSKEAAESLYKHNNMISPMKELWDEPFYHEPDPYFSGQKVGRQYIELAPYVPMRTSSPYRGLAIARISEAVDALREYAELNPGFSRDSLIPIAQKLLEDADLRLRTEMKRNVFLVGGGN